jgi:hypothetical protein
MQTIRQVIMFGEKWGKDIVNHSRVQLLADLLTEELLNEARGHFMFSLKEVLVIVC